MVTGEFLVTMVAFAQGNPSQVENARLKLGVRIKMSIPVPRQNIIAL